jgi:uncharacterized membrane protein (UPF0127 family)
MGRHQEKPVPPERILNATRQTCLASCVERADNYFKRLRGLMFRPSLPPEHGLWIVPCADIHSCFMRFPFDAVFVNKQLEVLYLLESMKPWRISRLVKGGHAVLELPAGTIAQSRTEIGDRLAWEPASLQN